MVKMTSSMTSNTQYHQINGRPTWRSGAVHVDIDAYDISMDIGHSHGQTSGPGRTATATGKHDLRQRTATPLDSKEYVHSTIQPFTRPPQSPVGRTLAELKGILGDTQSTRIVLLGFLTVLCIFILLVWSQTTDSMALTAYSSILLFDLMSLCTGLVTVWVTRQRPSSAYSFGYERFEVLAVFTSTTLASFSAIFIIKECTERIFEQPEIHTGRLMLGAALGFVCHMFVTYAHRNSALTHVSASSSSSWLQEHTADICKSLCTVVPGLDHLLLPRINPFALVGFAGAAALTVADFLIDVNNYHAADTWASYVIALMLIGTMLPLSMYSGTILLQTTPAYVIGQLDKCLREASTLDGVLEFRNEHFWTLSYGTLAGSLHVRVRRDADEQLVLAHVTNKLYHLVSPLTVQIIKDDWTRVSAMSTFSSGHLDQKLTPPAPLPGRYSSLPTNQPPHAHPSQHLLQQKKLGPLAGAASFKYPRASSTPFSTPSKDSGIGLGVSEPSPILPRSVARTGNEGSRPPRGILRNAGYESVPLAPQRNASSLSYGRAGKPSSESAVIDIDLDSGGSFLGSNGRLRDMPR